MMCSTPERRPILLLQLLQAPVARLLLLAGAPKVGHAALQAALAALQELDLVLLLVQQLLHLVLHGSVQLCGACLQGSGGCPHAGLQVLKHATAAAAHLPGSSAVS
jgi:hypothetical protein